MTELPNRCRLVLAASPDSCTHEALDAALSGGDVASVILYHSDPEDPSFESYCDKLVPIIQNAGAAVMIRDDTRIAGRCEADGIYLERNRSDLADVIARFSPQKIVGCGGIMTRHNALQVGELGPDFVLLGKTGKDIKPEAHPKNLALGEWWAQFVEIPAIVPGGNNVQSVVEVAKAGVDFVLLDKAVFGGDENPELAVKAANELLDAHAPDFDELSA